MKNGQKTAAWVSAAAMAFGVAGCEKPLSKDAAFAACMSQQPINDGFGKKADNLFVEAFGNGYFTFILNEATLAIMKGDKTLYLGKPDFMHRISPDTGKVINAETMQEIPADPQTQSLRRAYLACNR